MPVLLLPGDKTDSVPREASLLMFDLPPLLCIGSLTLEVSVVKLAALLAFIRLAALLPPN